MEMLRVTTLLEVLSAAALVWRVDWDFEQTGGIFLCAPPGHIKTQLLVSLEEIPHVKGLGDMTSQDLRRLQAKLESRDIRTIIFYELPKLYERRSETANMLMGHLRALIDEGFTGLANEQAGMRVRAVLIAAMPLKFLRDHQDKWAESGLLRRVMTVKFRLENPEALTDAILVGRKIRLHPRRQWIFPVQKIPMSITEEESRHLLTLLKDQDDVKTPLIMLKKIGSVLRAKNRALNVPDNTMQMMTEFGLSLRNIGVDVHLPVEDAAGAAKNEGDGRGELFPRKAPAASGGRIA